MGKQPKQQVISRFFSPQPKTPLKPSISQPSKPSPKISAIASFSPSPSKRRRSLSFSPSKKPKPSFPPKIQSLQSPIPPKNQSLQSPISPQNQSIQSPIPSVPHKNEPLQPPNPSILHQKFLSKFLDPNPSDQDSKTESSSKLSYTPLEQQVVDLKSKHPDVILMIEVGYRYRFFGTDADVAARVLGIIAHLDRNFLTASVPTFRLDFHVRRLVGAGYKVGVVKQTETAAIKSHGSNKSAPFIRSLSSLYTKSTFQACQATDIPQENNSTNSSNWILCIVEQQIAGKEGQGIAGNCRVGVVGAELASGRVVHGELGGDAGVRSAVEAVLAGLDPVEVLVGGPVSAETDKLILSYAGPKSNVRIERTSRECFKEGGALAEVMSLYENNNNTDYHAINNDYDEIMGAERNDGKNTLNGVEGIMGLPELVIQAMALMIRYLKEFGLERIICCGSSFKPISNNFEMNLSANTLHQLEVLKNNSDGSSQGSLFQVMNNTCTSFGSRLFKQWLIHPLCDINLITARLDAVSEILDSSKSGISKTGISNPDLYLVLSSVLTMLSKSIDVERGITRIFHRTAKPNEFIGVIQAILTAAKEWEKLNNDQNAPVRSSLLRRLICTATSASVISRAVKLLSCLNKDSADNSSDMSNLFNLSNNQFPEVATGRINVEIAKEKLNSLIYQYRKQLKMSNLEFKTIAGTSHLIELDSNVKVPSNWAKINSTKKHTRYHPPEVLKALDDLLLAKEEFQVICRKNWTEFLIKFEEHYTHFKAVVESFAALDCLVSLATLAKDKNYVRPVFAKEDEPREINIKCGRHPVLETILGDNFVPNDTNLRSDGEFCQIVTGPNMGGKSCYIRQVALISLMAQVGSFVPASSARLQVLDQILTRMGASDCMQKGRSTFFDELNETSQIIKTCTASSLVIIDELGRGTSTHDGTAIAYETLKYLIKEKKCMVIFVTHYPKILDVVKELSGQVGVFRVSFVTNSNNNINNDSNNNNNDNNNEVFEGTDVTFLYKVVRGASDKSFGLNVARLAQLPSTCISRAAIMAGKLEAELNQRKNKDKKDEILSEENGKYEIISNMNISEEIFRGILSNLTLARTESDRAKILCYLNEARELALNVIKGC